MIRATKSAVLVPFLFLWSAIWTLGLPVLLLYLGKRARKDPEYFAHLPERFGRYRDSMEGCVWIHAVSLGELRSAVPLIRGLLNQGEKIVVTHFTPAGRREAEQAFAPEIGAGQLRPVWVPIETAWAWRGFFRAFQPKFGLVMEIEIWPRMVFAAQAARVPLFMCNAQYPLKSLTRDSGGLRLRQKVMQGFAGALVKSQVQADRFASVGVRNIAITGELRFDQPVPQALLKAGQAARRWIGAHERRVICIASAIEGEDAVYLHAIAALRREAMARQQVMPLFVYVPRRPERFDLVASALQDGGLSVLRRSAFAGEFMSDRWGPAPECPDVFMGDSLGEMYAYLSMADEVIVGGGFNPKGAHNISEALVLGRPVVTGPHVHTIEYPFAEAKAAGVARSVRDAEELTAVLLSEWRPDKGRIEGFVAAHSNATDRTLAALPKLLRPS